MNNLNVFVRLSGFIHPTSRRMLLESSKRTDSTLEDFLVFSRRRPPLCSGHATDMITYAAFFRKQQTEIDVSGSRCLAITMRSSIHCMSLVGQTRRSACDIVGPRATARNATHTKASQRNRAHTPLFFDTTYKIDKFSAQVDKFHISNGASNTLHIALATKWLRLLSLSPNDKIRNHLVANAIFSTWVIPGNCGSA